VRQKKWIPAGVYPVLCYGAGMTNRKTDCFAAARLAMTGGIKKINIKRAKIKKILKRVLTKSIYGIIIY
jgi:hypothetical protein